MTNRLATIKPDNRGALRAVLDHLNDRSGGEYQVERDPDNPHIQNEVLTEYGTALEMLNDPAYGNTQVADALTLIAREDNLGVIVNEAAIRRWRKSHP